MLVNMGFLIRCFPCPLQQNVPMVEYGQHDRPESEQVAHRAIMNTLAFLGHIDAPAPEEISA